MAHLPFTLRTIEELVDGRVFVEWETRADDGEPLIEGDHITPCGKHPLEDCVREFVADVKERRERHNRTKARPKRRKPPRKRKTATLSESDKKKLMKELDNGDS